MSRHRDLIDRDLHAPSNERVENNTISPILKMRAVTFDGFGTAFMQVKLGDGAVDLIAGITQETVNNVTGFNTEFITALGILTNLDTSAFVVNDILFAGANGVLQNTQNGPPIAQVLVSDALQGKIYVQIPHRTPGIVDEKVKVSSNDTTEGFLNGKLTAGTGIVLTEQNDGGNETLEVSAPGSTTDEKVSVSANDTTPGFLTDKIVVDSGTNTTNPLESSELNDGADEDLRIRFDESKVDHDNLQNVGTNTHADIDNHLANTNNPHITTFTQAVTADSGTDITAAEAETLTDGSDADALHTHASGEVNTASNIGTAGVGSFKQKTGLDLEFKNINSGSNKVSITDDVVNDEIDIDINEANIIHQNLSGAGTNTHTDIDNHIADTSNPHSVDFTQAVAADSGTDITAAEAETLTDGSNADALHTHAASLDEKVKVSANDTTPGFLNGKLVAGANVTLTENNDGGNETLTIDTIAPMGESNTASNVGVGGVGPFKQKTGVDLEFKNINAGSNKVSITDDVANNEIDIDVVEANIIHQNLSGSGTNTHTDIDNHIANVSNPHSVSFTQSVTADAGTDITAAEAETLTDGSNADALHTHVSNEANTASNVGVGGVGPFKQKTGVNLEFKNINSGSNRVSITDDVANNEIDVDVVEANIIHQNLSGAGTNTHADIDNHIANISNPHSVSFTQSVAADAGTDITAVETETLTDGSNADALHTHAASLDEKVKVSANDTTPGFLNGKLTAGVGIILTEQNDGGNENLEISSSVSPGAILTALFASTANNVNNKFLASELVATSDDVPGVVPVSETLTKLVFTNSNFTPTGDLEIRVNTTVGIPAITASLTTLTRSEIFAISLAVVAGDELNCKVINASGIGKPLVKLYA